MSRLITLVTLIAAVAQINCAHERDSASCGEFETWSETEKLVLINCIALGSSYQDVKRLIPGISELHDEGGLPGLGRRGLTEAVAYVVTLGHQAELEANFKGDSLYAILYWLKGLPPAEADSLCDILSDFYDGQFGKGQTEQENSEGYEHWGRYWCSDGIGVVVGNNGYQQGNSLAWGFQSRCP